MKKHFALIFVCIMLCMTVQAWAAPVAPVRSSFDIQYQMLRHNTFADADDSYTGYVSLKKDGNLAEVSDFLGATLIDSSGTPVALSESQLRRR